MHVVITELYRVTEEKAIVTFRANTVYSPLVSVNSLMAGGQPRLRNIGCKRMVGLKEGFFSHCKMTALK